MRNKLLSAAARVAVVGLLAVSAFGSPPQNVVTTLADYEDSSIAIRISGVRRVLAADCALSYSAIPARGQRSLTVEVGATQTGASAAVDLRFRIAKPFAQADRLATYAWINEGYAEIGFRIRDAADRIFETTPKPIGNKSRWVRLDTALTKDVLTLVAPKPAQGAKTPAMEWPIEVLGYRVVTRDIGRQTVYIDDLEVEHRASGAEVLQGEFVFSNPTRVYEPGALVRAGVFLENLSRKIALPLSVDVAWLLADGTELTSARKSITLPPSGESFRSRQPVDFSQRVLEPGLYRLVARVSGPGWSTPAVVESTIAVMTSNRALPRGRETFFGIRSNLLRESPVDQDIEIAIAREIGVQLLALDVPWRAIEPSPGRHEFRLLDEVVDLLIERDIAVMLILVDRPEWLEADADKAWQHQVQILDTLAQRFGKRVTAFMPLLPNPQGEDWERLLQLEKKLKDVESNATLMAPPIAVDATKTLNIPADVRDKLPLVFETTGPSTPAVADLIAFGQRNDIQWKAPTRWLHESDTAAGAGDDAETILRHFMQGAAKGVGGVIWFDLRDDSAQPDQLDKQRGLVRRDFSPRDTLIGFANAVGMLHGLVYAGEVVGTPEEFDSATFIGGQTQVGVFFPKPNRILPALIAPRALVPGEVSILNFARVEQPQFGPLDASLSPMMERPFFTALFMERAQGEAQFALARPWIRAPQVVLCDEKAELHVEIDAIESLSRSYVQLLIPDDAGITSSASSRLLRAKRGETLPFDATLSHTGTTPLKPTTLTLRARIEGETYEVPIRLEPLHRVAAAKRNEPLSDERFNVGLLEARVSAGRKPAKLAVYIGYERRELRIEVDLPAALVPGAYLDFGLAEENANLHQQARITHLRTTPALEPLASTDSAALRSWRCRRLDSGGASGAGRLEITIPTRSLEASSLKPGMRFLAAITLVIPPTDAAASPVVQQWGSGVGDPRRTLGYKWLVLGE